MALDAAFYDRLSRFLPEELLAQLPDTQALATAVRRLSRLQQALASFLPQYIADNEQFYSGAHGDLRPGTFLFADVSGFTALSEELQRKGGREGAEVLTQVINDFFAAMLDILAKSDGQLLKFAGDALLAFFPKPPHRDHNEAPLAIRTGLRMQRAMRAGFQPLTHPALTELIGPHTLALTMSIGICQGQLFEAVVGNTMQRDHVIQGGLPGQAMAAEAAGDRDDVIITEKLYETLGDQFTVEMLEDGFCRIIDDFGDDLGDYEFVVPSRRRASGAALFGFDEEDLLADVHSHLERLEGVARFVSQDVVNRLAFKGDHIESENRPSTVIFVHFTGFADLLARWGEAQLPLITSLLNRYYGLMQRTVAANEGSFNRTDPYQRGVKMLITFGAPVAHADDPERAVVTALEMNRKLAAFNVRLREELPEALTAGLDTLITQRIGITHGMVFAGEVGWRARREYTVMGDSVNLAARLMSKAEFGQILIDQTVWERVHTHFEIEPLPPLTLKGKREPVPAYRVKAGTPLALSMSPTSDTPFVGRDLELLTLSYGLQQAKGPRRSQVFVLQGEAGTGKTRMARQVSQMAVASGFQVAWATCQLGYSQQQSVWSALVFQLLQLDQARSASARRRLLQLRLAEWGEPELEAVLGVLLFGLHAEGEMSQGATAASSAPPPERSASGAVNIFDLAHVKTDLTTSGIFGMARDQLQEALEAAQRAQSSVYTRVEHQTSIPEAIVRLLKAAARQIPTLLVIDDVHRADTTTRSILKTVAAAATGVPLMLILTSETEGILERDRCRRIPVVDLDEGDTTQLAAAFLGCQRIDPTMRALLWTRTRGRPLFVESLLRLLQQQGRIVIDGETAALVGDVDATTLPENVRELILSQIDQLSPQARELLKITAIWGDGFTVEPVVALSEHADALQIETLLGELVHAEIIEMLPDMTYRFWHGLAETTVYESMNRLQRQRLHRTAAKFLQAQDASDHNVLRVAYHYVKGGMPMRGIELVSAAAERAEAAGHIEQAIELLHHARTIMPHDESIRAQIDRLQALRS